MTVLQPDDSGLWDMWDPEYPGEPQPGCTYQVQHYLNPPGAVNLVGVFMAARPEWLRPATPEEIAHVRLASLAAGL